MAKYKDLKNKVRGVLASLLLICVFPALVAAQTFGEFFKQKKTQKRYLLEQIAALQVYLGYAKKGYDLVGSGLRTVKDLSNGEFSLHSAFISSLSAVSPFVRDNVKVAQIIACQLEIVKGFNAIGSGASAPDGGLDLLSAANFVYIHSVRARVLAECSGELQELILVVTPGLVEMNDHERLSRLDRLYLSMRDKADFTRAFCEDVFTLSRSRSRELRSLDFLNHAYENE